jgi:hypothetical protein
MMKTVKESQTLTPLHAAKAAAGEATEETFRDRSKSNQIKIEHDSNANRTEIERR